MEMDIILFWLRQLKTPTVRQWPFDLEFYLSYLDKWPLQSPFGFIYIHGINLPCLLLHQQDLLDPVKANRR